MIKLTEGLNDIIKIVRAEFIKQSELDGQRVVNGFSFDGSNIDLQLQEGQLSPSSITDCFCVFYCSEVTSANDNARMTETDGSMTMYQTYDFHVALYGQQAGTIAKKTIARFELQQVHESLETQGVHLINIDGIVPGTDFLNSTAWPRRDFTIIISARHSIEPLTKEEQIEDADISGLQMLNTA